MEHTQKSIYICFFLTQNIDKSVRFHIFRNIFRFYNRQIFAVLYVFVYADTLARVFWIRIGIHHVDTALRQFIKLFNCSNRQSRAVRNNKAIIFCPIYLQLSAFRNCVFQRVNRNNIIINLIIIQNLTNAFGIIKFRTRPFRFGLIQHRRSGNVQRLA